MIKFKIINKKNDMNLIFLARSKKNKRSVKKLKN